MTLFVNPGLLSNRGRSRISAPLALSFPNGARRIELILNSTNIAAVLSCE
jgi:hypothetical protein